ncbi:15675_t:CDS:2 [Racocetra fulgida]|uniref:15675_t:CDS:1 n=1 Tax=Racocetra fulgida TaxID=60492 RepID=A0A9N9CU03_9GLOM|nr:15675_t:CDS:2 [Racocetra fulgida]
MTKYTLERLQKHLYVFRVIEDGMAIICICGKRIVLKSKYNETYIDFHVNGSGCNRSSGTRAITKFFSLAEKTVIPEQKCALCKGLHEDIHINYIERAQFVSLYGGVLRKDTIARSMFPKLFLENVPVQYALLNKDQHEQLNKAVRAQAKWKIEGRAVYAQNCEIYTSNNSEVCNQYVFINSDQVFHINYLINYKIKAVIHQAFKHAKILTENVLNMTTISFQLYNPLIFDNENNSEEILDSINSNYENLDDINNIENLFISTAATEIYKDNWNLPDESYSDFEEG